MKRSGGVLMHISSLPGPYGIGTLGEGGRNFIRFLHECAFTSWQVLPLGPCDSYNSPYSGESAFAGNIFFIDPQILFNKNLLTKSELDSCICDDIYVSDYEFLKKTRKDIFKKAFMRLDENMKNTVKDFCKSNPWVHNYALFCAIGEKQEKAWYDWEEPLKMRDKKALLEIEKELSDEIFFHEFLQCEFFNEWYSLKEYANSLGIKIIGDMSIYLSHNSADAWENPQFFSLDENMYLERCAGVPQNPQFFSLDENMYLERCAGVPPDYFCKEGQKWGHPLYNWENLKKENYSLWINRLRLANSMYDATRIDHFRAFSSFWSIPAKESATEGKWEKGPGIEFFNYVKDLFPSLYIIAEDLGDIDNDVRKLVKETGFPGMGVMQFAFITDDDTVHLPHNYSEKTIGYTGTHDNNTILGWLWESDENVRRYALDYCGFSGDWGQGGPKSESVRAFIRTLWKSGALISIVPVQDLCGFGSDTCMNHPGIAEGNWRFRITYSALDNVDKDFFRHINFLYKRA